MHTYLLHNFRGLEMHSHSDVSHCDVCQIHAYTHMHAYTHTHLLHDDLGLEMHSQSDVSRRDVCQIPEREVHPKVGIDLEEKELCLYLCMYVCIYV